MAQRRKIAWMNETQVTAVCTPTLLINMAGFCKIRTVYGLRLFYVQTLAFYKNFFCKGAVNVGVVLPEVSWCSVQCLKVPSSLLVCKYRSSASFVVSTQFNP